VSKRRKGSDFFGWDNFAPKSSRFDFGAVKGANTSRSLDRPMPWDQKFRPEQNLKDFRPAVFCFNHQSSADFFIIMKLLRKDITGVAKKELEYLKTISYQKNDPNHNEISSHNKIWIVDGHLFYIGSHNIYPSSLQQFGVIVDSKTATNMLEQQWWHPLWKNAVNAPLENSA